MALIMVVEDNPDNMMLVRDLLSLGNHQVVECNDALETLKILKETCPDLILLDIQLPNMDGFELARLIRKQPEYSNTPIIACTALVMPRDREKIKEVGMNDFISKPINTRSFLKTIEKHI